MKVEATHQKNFRLDVVHNWYAKWHGCPVKFHKFNSIFLAQGRPPLFSEGPLCFLCHFDMAAAPMSLWIGVALVVFGLCIGTGGMQLIRVSELKMKDDRVVESRVLFVVGLILNMALGPAALIAPFTGVNIVLNVVVARLLWVKS